MTRMRAMALATVVAAASQSVGSKDATDDVPALLIDPTAATTAELRGVLETMLPGRRILLADDALTKSSLLIVDRRRHQRLAGSLAAGVADETPHRFQLVVRDSHPVSANSNGQTREASGLATDGSARAATATACELVHLNTGKRRPLPQTRCRAEPRTTE